MKKIKAFLAWFNPFNDVSHMVEVKLERDEWKRKAEVRGRLASSWRGLADENLKKMDSFRMIIGGLGKQSELLTNVLIERDAQIRRQGEKIEEFTKLHEVQKENIKGLVKILSKKVEEFKNEKNKVRSKN